MSRPTGAPLAIAVVAAAVMVIRLARRSPARQDGLDGWHAALVPVAVPLTATPALLLLGLSAGADPGPCS